MNTYEILIFCLVYTRLAEKKKEAEAAISLMSAMYDRICNDEKKKLGLIIKKAEYGVFEIENNLGLLFIEIFFFLYYL